MSPRRSSAGDISLSVEDTNALRATLGLRPLRPTPVTCDPSVSDVGAKDNVVLGPAKKPRQYTSEVGQPLSSANKTAVANGSDTVELKATPLLATANSIVVANKFVAEIDSGLGDEDEDEDDDDDDDDVRTWVERMRKYQGGGKDSQSESISSSKIRLAHTEELVLGSSEFGDTSNTYLATESSAVLMSADCDVLNESGGELEGDVFVDAVGNQTVISKIGENGLQYPQRCAVNGSGGAVTTNTSAEDEILKRKDHENRKDGDSFADGICGNAQIPDKISTQQRFSSEPKLSSNIESEKTVKLDSRDEIHMLFKKKSASKSSKKRKKRSKYELSQQTDSLHGPAYHSNGLSNHNSVSSMPVDDRDGKQYETSSSAWLKQMRDEAASSLSKSYNSTAEVDYEDEDDDLQRSVSEARRRALQLTDALNVAPRAARISEYVQQSDGKQSLNRDGDSSGQDEDGNPSILVNEAEQFVGNIDLDLDVLHRGSFVRSVREDVHVQSPSSDDAVTTNNQQTVSAAENSTLDEIPDSTNAITDDPPSNDAKFDEEGFRSNDNNPERVVAINPLGTAQSLRRLQELGELNRPRLQEGRARDKKIILENEEGRVQLCYRDPQGRELTQKEAFRILSHKFHGKGPGQNKREARMRRQQQHARILGTATSEDTPLASVAAFKEETRNRGVAHVVLSGSSALGHGLAGPQSLRKNSEELSTVSQNNSNIRDEQYGFRELRGKRETTDIVKFSLDVNAGNASKRLRRS